MEHHWESCTRATYVPTTYSDEFSECPCKHLEEVFLSQLVGATEFSLMADKTIDMTDRVQFLIFIFHLNVDDLKIKKEFPGLMEVSGSKSEGTLFNKIGDVLINIQQIKFSCFDRTNTMGKEISG